MGCMCPKPEPEASYGVTTVEEPKEGIVESRKEPKDDGIASRNCGEPQGTQGPSASDIAEPRTPRLEADAEEPVDSTPSVGPGSEPPSAASYISRSNLGPKCSLMEDSLPDWRFELDRGQWRSYPLEESLELDRYWQVYSKNKDVDQSAPHLAKVRLMKRDGVVDFSAMTCQVGGGRPRRLDRQLKNSGWLGNRYFFEAFKAALAHSDISVENSPEEMFDFRFNQDFTKMADDGRPLQRGGQPYKLPVGWKRFAVNVKGQYDSGDNSWLKEDDSGWAVAYHGTAGDSLPGILCAGFRVGDRQKFAKDTGAGIYCTPNINVAQHYSKPKLLEGHSVQVVLQLRVKPSAIKLITDATATEFERKYWVINDPADIRAYGVLVREFALLDWVPPEAMVFGADHPAVKKIYEDLRAEAAAQ